jgi:hypothetical protein
VAVQRFAAAAEGGHVSGGEAQPVAFDGDAAGNCHAVIVASRCGGVAALSESVWFVTIAAGARAPEDE